MSCIRFSTPEQRRSIAEHVPVMLTPEQAARSHPAPAMTESKLRRLRALAVDPAPKIRESVASSRHTPADVQNALALDADDGVRGCLARNTSAPPALLRTLAQDTSARVRGWVAVNEMTPADAVDRLSGDPDETVRALVAWRLDLEVPARA